MSGAATTSTIGAAVAELAPISEREARRLSPEDLVELIGAFNEVTGRLQATHATLVAEVGRLRTELGEANEALQRSKRLAALGEMAAGIAHEVRNPLASIGLYAQMLAADLADRPEQRVTAERIGTAVRGLNGIVTDVLHLAREQNLRPECCETAALVERAVRTLDGFGAGSARVVTRVDGEARTLVCDDRLVGRALVNVVRNGMEAIRVAGGDGPHVLAVEASREVDGARAFVVLRVRDTGDGISAGAIDRMFNPFFTTREAGTGLGLAIVHRIVDAHGGEVRVFNNGEREDGARGATFELVLPKDGPTGKETSPSEAERAA